MVDRKNSALGADQVEDVIDHLMGKLARILRSCRKRDGDGCRPFLRHGRREQTGGLDQAYEEGDRGRRADKIRPLEGQRGEVLEKEGAIAI